MAFMIVLFELTKLPQNLLNLSDDSAFQIRDGVAQSEDDDLELIWGPFGNESLSFSLPRCVLMVHYFMFRVYWSLFDDRDECHK